MQQRRHFARAAFMAGILTISNLSYAAEAQITAEPARYAFVQGDSEKFQEHHWMKEGYVGGIKEFSMQTDKLLGSPLSLYVEGGAIADQIDLDGTFEVKKEDVWYVQGNYSEFSKYYDGTGGFYRPFSTLTVNELDKELRLDIGRLTVETGITPKGWFPDVSFLYEHDFKDGAKSRLSWTAVRENTITRNIGPSYQDIDENTDSFQVSLDKDVAGFSLHGDQKWEFTRSELTREERSLSTTSTAADKKVRVQNQDPETDLMTSTLRVEKASTDEKKLFSAGYRYSHLDNRELESILELDASGVPQNFSNPKRILNALRH